MKKTERGKLMTFTITLLTIIKLLAICFCLGIGGLLTYLSYMGLMVGEGRKVPLSVFLLAVISLTLYGIYSIATYHI